MKLKYKHTTHYKNNSLIYMPFKEYKPVQDLRHFTENYLKTVI